MTMAVALPMAKGIPAGIGKGKKNRAPYGAPFCIKCRASRVHFARILSHDCRASRVRSFDFAQDDTGVARISLTRCASCFCVSRHLPSATSSGSDLPCTGLRPARRCSRPGPA